MAKHEMDVYKGRSWSPERELGTLHRGIDRLFDDFINIVPMQSQRRMRDFDFNPAVDVEEHDQHYLISIDLPGVKKDDVQIEINDNQLMISGERHEERKEEKKHSHFMERSYGRFERSFTLPANVEPEKVEADFDAGVLQIALPKSQASKGRTVEIGGQKGSGLLTRMTGKEQSKKAAS